MHNNCPPTPPHHAKSHIEDRLAGNLLLIPSIAIYARNDEQYEEYYSSKLRMSIMQNIAKHAKPFPIGPKNSLYKIIMLDSVKTYSKSKVKKKLSYLRESRGR